MSPNHRATGTTSRRKFVTALAAAPAFAAGASLLSVPGAAASVQRQQVLDDPTLAQLLTELRNLVEEGKAATTNRERKATIRSLESVLLIKAAHFARHYDPAFRDAARRRVQRIGRAQVVEQAVQYATGRYDNVRPDTIRQALAQVEANGGVAEALRRVQQVLRAMRQAIPDDAQRAVSVRAVQFGWDPCQNLEWQIEFLSSMAAIICGIAVVEPTPAGEAGCAAISITIGSLQVQLSVLRWMGNC